jgi:hypothetical protein
MGWQNCGSFAGWVLCVGFVRLQMCRNVCEPIWVIALMSCWNLNDCSNRIAYNVEAFVKAWQ